ncbi:MAG: TIGR04076 family protein [Methanobacteriota archaeon]|nr:MAG: TIGR04076 family protein [Euryarchaeota archaeon]
MEIVVDKVEGHCPVYKKGDIITITGCQIDLEQTDKLCIHALPSLLHYATPLREGVSPYDLGLAPTPESRSAYIQCPDPGPPHTKGGTVTFKLTLKTGKSGQA